MRQLLLQSATAFFITKCDGLLLQSATALLLQSATGIAKCDNFITKCDRYYKVRRYKVRQYGRRTSKPRDDLTERFGKTTA